MSNRRRLNPFLAYGMAWAGFVLALFVYGALAAIFGVIPVYAAARVVSEVCFVAFVVVFIFIVGMLGAGVG